MLRGLDGFFDTQSVYANCAVLRVRRGLVSQDFGGHSEGETPLPIPNRVVKPLSADGTWPARAWEGRSPPINCIWAVLRAGPFALLLGLGGAGPVGVRDALLPPPFRPAHALVARVSAAGPAPLLTA